MTPTELTFCNCAVFSFIVDEARQISLPIGVALWSPLLQWAKVRLPAASELPSALQGARAGSLIRAEKERIESWMREGRLPYAEEPMPAHEDRFWRHVQKLLIHRVRLSAPRAVDCAAPESELESLFRSVVLPTPPAGDLA